MTGERRKKLQEAAYWLFVYALGAAVLYVWWRL